MKVNAHNINLLLEYHCVCKECKISLIGILHKLDVLIVRKNVRFSLVTN